MAATTPYISVSMLQNAPTGCSWDIIPSPGATEAAVKAELFNVAWRATSYIDTYCNQVLRATADTEYLNGPGQPRCNVDRNTGNGVLQMRRWPVTQVLAIQTSAATAFPRAWTPVPSGQYDIRHPLIYSGDTASATAPDGGWTIDVAPGYISWSPGVPSTLSGAVSTWSTGGRGGQRVQVCYINGWPHTSLTSAAVAGATTLAVDDVTGWEGASGFAYDGAATETVSVSSVAATTPLTLPNGAGTAQAGAGTITIPSPGLAYDHAEGTVISALPANVILAAVWAAAGQALEAGIDAIAVQSIGGEHIASGEGGKSLFTEAELLLDPYRRIV